MNDVIKNGIAEAIRRGFGDEYSIYADNVEQGMKKPCFFILNKKCVFERLLGKRAAVTYRYGIEVYEDDREKLEKVLMRLFAAMDMISTAEGKMFGRNMSFSVEKGKGIFEADFRCVVMFEEEKSEYMEVLEREEV